MTHATIELTRPEFGDPPIVFNFEHDVEVRTARLAERLQEGSPTLGERLMRQFCRDTHNMLKPAVRLFAARVQSLALDKRCTDVSYEKIRRETGWKNINFIRESKRTGEMGTDKLQGLRDAVYPFINFPSLAERQIWPHIGAIQSIQRIEGFDHSLDRERYELARDLISFSDWLKLRSFQPFDAGLLQERLEQSLNIVRKDLANAYFIDMDNPDAVYKPRQYKIGQVDELLWELGPAFKAWSNQLAKQGKKQ